MLLLLVFKFSCIIKYFFVCFLSKALQMFVLYCIVSAIQTNILLNDRLFISLNEKKVLKGSG